jgi:hypothetical protein
MADEETNEEAKAIYIRSNVPICPRCKHKTAELPNGTRVVVDGHQYILGVRAWPDGPSMAWPEEIAILDPHCLACKGTGVEIANLAGRDYTYADIAMDPTDYIRRIARVQALLDEMPDECDHCASKSGSPLLCHLCQSWRILKPDIRWIVKALDNLLRKKG